MNSMVEENCTMGERGKSYDLQEQALMQLHGGSTDYVYRSKSGRALEP